MNARPEPRYWILDLLRYATAMLVAFCHWRLETDIFRASDLVFLDTLAKDGNFGVAVFFIISGFVISLTAMRKKNAFSFLWARFARIFPGLLICMFLVLVIRQAGLILPLKSPLQSFLGSITLTYPIFGIEALTSVLWTLIVEMNFYFIVFCFLLVDHSLFYDPLKPFFIFGLWIFLFYLLLAYFPKTLQIFIGLSGFFPFFCLGVSIFFLTQGFLLPKILNFVWIFFPVLVFYIFFSKETSNIKSIIFLLSVVTILLSPLCPPLDKNVFKITDALGAASYPIYLLHTHLGVGMILCLKKLGFGGYSLVIISILFLTGFCIFLSRFLETPLRKILIIHSPFK